MKRSSFVFAIFLLLMLWVVLPYLFVTLNQRLDLPIFAFDSFRWLGIVFMLLGITLASLASITFMRFGDGTPVITEPPKILVFKGVYKYTRNPIYLAHITICAGIFLFFGHAMLLIYMALVAIGLHCYVISIEEPKLMRRHGNAYLDYTHNVRRWI